MKWTAIDIFHKQLKNIRKHIDDIQIYKRILEKAANNGDDDAKTVLDMNQSERIFRYKAVIISAYGAYEWYIEELLREYIKNLRELHPNFSKLDPRIQTNLVDKWKLLHGKLKYPKYESIKVEDIVQSLYEAICMDMNSIKPEYYTQNGGNYKCKVVREMLLDVGIDQFELLKEYCEMPKTEEDLTFETLINHVDEIVDRRNLIAHTIVDEEILDSGMQMVYIDQLGCFVDALQRFVEDKFNDLIWGEIPDEGKLKAYNALSEQKVLIFQDVENAIFKNGQLLIVCMQEETYPRYKYATIDEIRVEEVVGKVVTVQELDQSKHYYYVSIHFNDSEVVHNKVKIADVSLII